MAWPPAITAHDAARLGDLVGEDFILRVPGAPGVDKGRVPHRHRGDPWRAPRRRARGGAKIKVYTDGAQALCVKATPAAGRKRERLARIAGSNGEPQP